MSSNRPIERFRRLRLEALEERRLLSVTAAFDGNELLITGNAPASAGDTIVIGTDAGAVTVNNIPVMYGSPPVTIHPWQVQALTVQGSPGDDTIDARNVDVQWGNGTVEIFLYGNSGVDTIHGSPLRDNIFGGTGSFTDFL